MIGAQGLGPLGDQTKRADHHKVPEESTAALLSIVVDRDNWLVAAKLELGVAHFLVCTFFTLTRPTMVAFFLIKKVSTRVYKTVKKPPFKSNSLELALKTLT